MRRSSRAYLFDIQRKVEVISRIRFEDSKVFNAKCVLFCAAKISNARTIANGDTSMYMKGNKRKT